MRNGVSFGSFFLSLAMAFVCELRLAAAPAFALKGAIVGSWGGAARGPASDIFVRDGLAYLGVDDVGLVIADVRDPLKPMRLGTCQLGTADIGLYATRLVVSGNYAYVVGDGIKLCIVDIGDPSHPTLVKEVALNLDSIKIVGRYAYLWDSTHFLIVDLIDPTTPVPVGNFGGTLASLEIRSLDVVGSLAYLATDHGLIVVDVSDPVNPRRIGQASDDGYQLDLAAVGKYALVAEDDLGLAIFNVEEKARPFLVGRYATDIWAEQLFVNGNTAIISGRNGEFEILDVSDPSQPNKVSSFQTPGWGRKIAFSGDKIFVADGGNGLQIIDSGNLAMVKMVGVLDLAGRTTDVKVAGRYAYLADGDAGLRIIDIAVPSAPVEIARCALHYSAYAIALAENKAFVSTSCGYAVIDITDPSSPFVIIEETAALTGWNIVVAANQVFFIDIIVHMLPTTGPFDGNASGFWASGSSFSAAAKGTALLIGDSDEVFDVPAKSGLEILDISEVLHPQPISFLETPQPVGTVSIIDNFAFVTTRTNRLDTIDISDLAHPKKVASYRSADHFSSLRTPPFGSRLAIPSGSRGLRFLDVTEPARIVDLGLIPTRGAAGGVDFKGDLAFVADGMFGLTILKLETNTLGLISGPLGRTNQVGTTAVFEVNAVGENLTYEWKRNGKTLVDGTRIHGATTDILTIQNVALGDSGDYSVTVRSGDAAVAPSVVSLATNTKGILVRPEIADGKFALVIPPNVGARCRIEYADELPAIWKEAATLLIDAAGQRWVEPEDMSRGNRYYRVVAE